MLEGSKTLADVPSGPKRMYSNKLHGLLLSFKLLHTAYSLSLQVYLGVFDFYPLPLGTFALSPDSLTSPSSSPSWDHMSLLSHQGLLLSSSVHVSFCTDGL